MKINNKYVRFISIILITCFLNFCVSYNRVALPKESLKVETKKIFLHYNNSKFEFINAKIENNQLVGDVKAFNVKSKNKPLQELNIYVDVIILPTLTVNEKAIIPYDAIQKIEINKVNEGKTIVNFIGIMAVIFVLSLIGG